MLLSTFISWLWLGFEITPGFALGARWCLQHVGSPARNYCSKV